MDWEAVRSRAENVFGSEPSSIHLGVLMLMTVTLLGLAIAKVMYSQFPTSKRDDTVCDSGCCGLILDLRGGCKLIQKISTRMAGVSAFGRRLGI